MNEHNKAEWVLRKMTISRKHLAIVLDEFGGTEAIVSHEDLIEELLGMEIEDEMDKKEKEKLSQQQIQFQQRKNRNVLYKERTAMWNKNRLTQMLSIEYPIIQAGMAGSTTPKLVASVSNSGGLGTIGAGYFNTQQLEDEIDYVRQLTSNSFGVNVFVPSQQSYTSSQLKIPSSPVNRRVWCSFSKTKCLYNVARDISTLIIC